MMGLVALWSHLLAACLFAGLVLWQLRHRRGDEQTRPLITAFAVMAVWSIFMGVLGPYHFLSLMADSARDLAFLAFMYGLMNGGEDDYRQGPVKIVYGTVAAVIALQIVLAGLLPRFEDVPAVVKALVSTRDMIGLTIAAGALVLVHNVYGQATAESRGLIRPPMVALALMWVYDLHLYTVSYLTRDSAEALIAMRGVVVALLVPIFAMGLKRTTRLKVQLSRAATFQSLSLVVLVGYLILMMSVSRAVEFTGGGWLEFAELSLLGAMSVAALILLPSARARSWLNVMVQKHLFQHRYDYREEWLRFTATVSGGEAPLEQRVIKAMADIGGASAGMLLLREADDRLSPAGTWNWAPPGEAPEEGWSGLIALVERTAHIIEFTGISGGELQAHGDRTQMPGLFDDMPDAWAGIPLIHNGRLVGLVIIGHPPARRALDWEDFDLFRAAGRQAASYIAEAQTMNALAQAQRFDEFNRRFAFIMHDIKNLVSQLSLVARNAERHADNPAFRADMALTLQSSVKKMNDMLARIAPGAKADRAALSPRPIDLHQVLAPVAEDKKRLHPVAVSGDARIMALADPVALDQAVTHLVQNAIDASPREAPVEIAFARRDGQAVIEVRDRGCGMSAEFVRARLFQPFVSTKDGGFGIGAHEARALIEQMGGRIEVDSRPGAGSRFTIRLRLADSEANSTSQRISA